MFLLDKCVKKIDGFPLGTQVLNIFMERDVYNQTLLNFSNTLTITKIHAAIIKKSTIV